MLYMLPLLLPPKPVRIDLFPTDVLFVTHLMPAVCNRR